ncbi:MAG: 50S ribosomal protein L33, partial [Patescibacteria group bacterium]
MPKQKGPRIKIALKCSNCGDINYTTEKNRNETEELELRKFCRRCTKHTIHVEED